MGRPSMTSGFLLGAERVIAIDRFPERLKMARTGRAETINYEETSVYDASMEMTGGRGPDPCIDAVGLEAHGGHGFIYAYDHAKQDVMAERSTDCITGSDHGLSKRGNCFGDRRLRRIHR